MTRRPLVSIGMPVYNGGKHVGDAINSLLAQTFTDFELMISDNASTDDTEAICHDFAKKDPRVTYLRQKENIGGLENFKFLLREAGSDIFMWAAHDDLWAKNYLENAVPLLDDKNIQFVFPTFKLQSIKFRISKKISRDIFKFIESEDRKKRVLEFFALHHASHKCNIVYALYRTKFLQITHGTQDITNDGAFGMVVLGMSRGRLLDGSLFCKRYPRIWPGPLGGFYSFIYPKMEKDFLVAKEAGLQKINLLFPEYQNDFKKISDQYHLFSHGKSYKVCSIDDSP